MSEMEVISLQTGCKGVYRRWEFFGGARLPKDPERNQGSKCLETGSLR
jgi:hypothetical protein